MFYGLQAFPTPLRTLLLLVEYLTLFYAAPKAIGNVVASLRFHHERLGFSFKTFEHLQLRLALRSLPFTLRATPSPALPFPPSLLGSLLAAGCSLGPWALPFRALCLFAFYSFARLASLVPASAFGFDVSRFPTLADLSVQGDRAALRIKFSKTRQAADGGFWAPFLPVSSGPCPVQMARVLKQRALRLGLGPFCPLFSAFRQTGGAPLPLTQARARLFLRQCLQQLRLPLQRYSFHSFRRGGCTFAFQQGAVESDLALHGDWRSSAVRAYYPADGARLRVASLLSGNPPPFCSLSNFLTFLLPALTNVCRGEPQVGPILNTFYHLLPNSKHTELGVPFPL